MKKVSEVSCPPCPPCPQGSKPIKKPNKNETENEIVELLRQNSEISREEMAYKLSRSEDSVRYYLRKLMKDGKIVREGSKKTGKWIVL